MRKTQFNFFRTNLIEENDLISENKENDKNPEGKIYLRK